MSELTTLRVDSWLIGVAWRERARMNARRNARYSVSGPFAAASHDLTRVELRSRVPQSASTLTTLLVAVELLLSNRSSLTSPPASLPWSIKVQPSVTNKLAINIQILLLASTS